MDLQRIPENASLENSSGHSDRFLCSAVQQTRDAGACILAVIYGRIFFAIGQTNDYRAQLIQTGIEQNQKEIVLPMLPYSEYCWVTVPPNEKWKKYFKKFYHIPEDVTLRFE